MKKISLFSALLCVALICSACSNHVSSETQETNKILADKNQQTAQNVEEKQTTNGLTKIGKMSKSRIYPHIIKLDDDRLLILGGYNKFEEKERAPKKGGGLGYKIESVEELSAEIFNIKTNKSELLKSKPLSSYYMSAEKLSNGNIMFAGGKTPQIFIEKSNEFIELPNIFNDNYTGLNTKFVELNENSGMFCTTYVHEPDNVRCFLVDTNKFTLLKTFEIPPFNNNMFKYSTVLKLGSDKLLIFTTMRGFNTPNREVYISEYSISKKDFIKHTIIENIGNEVNVNAINDDLVLISGIRRSGYGSELAPTLSIYSSSKEKIIKTFDIKEYNHFYKAERDGLIKSFDYVLNPETLELEPNNFRIDWQKYNLPEKSITIRVNNDKYYTFGGKSKNGKALADIYMIDNP